jgi:hypothetical protein
MDRDRRKLRRMMRFEVLTDAAPGAARWRWLTERLAQQSDIHFLPEYGTIYRKTYGYEPFLAVYGDDSRFVLQPFVKRSLNALPFLRDQGITQPYHDIASPYGYGGPVYRCESAAAALELYRSFDACLIEYCRRERLASEFTSLHPFFEGPRLLAGAANLARQKEVVYIELPGSEAQRWKATRKGHKSSIARARRSGVRVEKVAPTAENFEELNRLYFDTMERNRAAQRWIFPRDYFGNCYECLGERRVSLFFARVGEALASASILMHDFDTAYYHFSGSDSRYHEYCPNNLMVFEMATWAEQNGYRRFHLGGGVSSAADDSLLVFKSGFSDRRATLYTHHRVLDRPTYDYLCDMKRGHELAQGGARVDSDYFPLYRR